MVNNYLKIAFRLLRKNRWQTLINVSGLGVGTACCVLIILYVHSELTFDSFIGGLGLYALASLSMQGRTKEISIRKVLGASEQSLMILLGKAYLYLIIVSIAISIPMTLYFMEQWLESFEYRIAPGWNILAMTSAIAILLGSLVISYQTIRLARMQPARVLSQD